FLWSFRNPAHEQRVRSLVENISKDVFVTCSVDIAPKWGEYERVTATALNAYLGPVMSGYLQKLDFSLKDLGYRHGLQITQCGGGGSLVRVKPETRTMTVGPDSAGAFPGPVCYGRGGSVPTVTDAELVLGYLDPDNFAGGKVKLDFSSAEKAIQDLGKKINMDA